MPILEDLYNILEKDNNTKKFKTKLIPFVKGSMKFLNNKTNVKLENELIVADIYELGELKFNSLKITFHVTSLSNSNMKSCKSLIIRKDL